MKKKRGEEKKRRREEEEEEEKKGMDNMELLYGWLCFCMETRIMCGFMTLSMDKYGNVAMILYGYYGFLDFCMDISLSNF